MSQVNQVKEAVDIVDEVGQRLDLKRAGSSFRALCPFHSEKSPSFFVNPQIQRYKCFGCGASGDVIEFLENYEGMTFLEALQYLADKTGIKLQQYTKTKDDEIREQLLEILQLASKYYAYLLTEHKLGEPARAYLKKRGINQSSIELFKLGYAPNSWDGLLNYLVKKKKYDKAVVEKTGLLIRNRSGRYYDRFRGRIMFPLKNHRGQVVGFSGRILESQLQDEQKQPKYINTPETQLYHKSQMLYGFSELFQQIRKKEEVIVTEGEFDVISSVQVHVDHIVAIKGSALTLDQAKLLQRVAKKILLALDADSAGALATKRAIEVIKDLEIDLRVIDLSNIAGVDEQTTHDADELIHHDHRLWKKAVKNSVSAYDFLINLALRNFDATTAEGKRQIIDELAPVLNLISHQVEKDFYLKKLADKLQVSHSILAQDIERFGRNKNKKNSQTQRKSSSTQSLDSVKNATAQDDQLSRLEDYLLFLLFNLPEDEVSSKAQQLHELKLINAQARQIIAQLLEFDQEYQLKSFANSLAEDLKAALMEWQQPDFIRNIDEINLDREWTKSLTKYRRAKIQQQLELHNQQLTKLDTKSNKTETELTQEQRLLEKIAKLQNQLKQLSLTVS